MPIRKLNFTNRIFVGLTTSTVCFWIVIGVIANKEGIRGVSVWLWIMAILCSLILLALCLCLHYLVPIGPTIFGTDEYFVEKPSDVQPRESNHDRFD